MARLPHSNLGGSAGGTFLLVMPACPYTRACVLGHIHHMDFPIPTLIPLFAFVLVLYVDLASSQQTRCFLYPDIDGPSDFSLLYVLRTS
jgi:hypothetical protein